MKILYVSCCKIMSAVIPYNKIPQFITDGGNLRAFFVSTMFIVLPSGDTFQRLGTEREKERQKERKSLD
jgi:hypothetical protein